MRTWKVIRPDDTVIVTILKNKNDGTYSYINLTKGHICPCRFGSIEEALNDMNVLQKQGRILSWEELYR